MNKISPLLSVGSILLDHDVVSRKRLFDEASMVIEQSYGFAHTEVFEALFSREKLGCTCLGRGVALPHGSMPDIERVAFCFIRTKKPLTLDAPDGHPVQLFLFLIVPETNKESYICLLKEAAAILADKQIRAQLLEASSPAQVCEIIDSWVAPPTESCEIQDDLEGEPAPETETTD